MNNDHEAEHHAPEPHAPAEPHAKSQPHAEYESNPFALIRPSYEGFKINAGTVIVMVAAWLGILLASVILGAVLLGIGSKAGTGGSALVFLLLFVAFMGLLVYLAPVPVRLSLAMARQERITVGQLFKNPFSLGVQLVLAQLLAGLAIIGGFILFIIPGILFSLWFMWVSYVVVDEGLTGTAALRRSKELSKNRLVDVFGAAMLPGVFGFLNIIPLLGTLVYLAIVVILIPLPAIRYLQLKGLKAHSDGKDVPTNGLNYVAIVAGLAYLALSTSANLAQVQKNIDNPAAPHPGNNSYYLEPK